MRNFILFSFPIFFGLFAFNLPQQLSDSDKVLKAVETKYAGYSSMDIDVKQTIVDDEFGDTVSKTNMNLIIKGDKFKMAMLGQVIYSDGKNIWIYYERSNKVQIRAVSEFNEGMLKPSDLFQLYKKDFKSTGEMQRKINNKLVDVVKLSPMDLEAAAYHTIRVFVDAKTSELLSAEIIEKSQQRLIFGIEKLIPNKSYSDAFFAFDALKHPGVKVQDLRKK